MFLSSPGPPLSHPAGSLPPTWPSGLCGIDSMMGGPRDVSGTAGTEEDISPWRSCALRAVTAPSSQLCRLESPIWQWRQQHSLGLCGPLWSSASLVNASLSQYPRMAQTAMPCHEAASPIGLVSCLRDHLQLESPPRSPVSKQSHVKMTVCTAGYCGGPVSPTALAWEFREARLGEAAALKSPIPGKGRRGWESQTWGWAVSEGVEHSTSSGS